MGCGCGNSGTTEINTLGCATPCTSGSSVAPTNCSCGNTPCQCGKLVTPAPTPFYNCGDAVQETHCKTIVQAQYVTAISTSTTFNMPACDTTAVLTIPGLTKIQIGSYLWNSTFGYLQVVAFDYVSAQITVENGCESGNASPGTNIPACTLFTVVDPPGISGGNSQIGIFLASDFVAVGNGNCVNIQVTGVAGLTIGENVQVGAGTYMLSAIISPTIITICDTGGGVVAGTVVPAKDISGNYITPVTPLSSNACTNAPVTSGALLTCHNGIQAPLDGTLLGQIPVLVDADTNEVEFQTLSLPTTVCTTITTCLNLISGTTSYTIPVADSSVFAINDILVIYSPGYEDVRWTVTNIVDPTHITINRTTPQTTTEEIGCNDATICLAPCCEQLQAEIDAITSGAVICDCDWHTAFKSELNTFEGAPEGGDLQAASRGADVPDLGLPTSLVGATGASVILVNDTCNPMRVLITFEYRLKGTLLLSPDSWYRYNLTCSAGWLEEAIGAGGTPGLVTLFNQDYDTVVGRGGGVDPCNPYNVNMSEYLSYSQIYNLPINKELVVNAQVTLNYLACQSGAHICDPAPGATTGSGRMTVGFLRPRFNLLGIAVQAA